MTVMSNRWRRLLAQPLAELAIIVAGVTIALWADDWATSRDQEQEEHARLLALQADVEDTLETLELEIEVAKGAEVAIRNVLSAQASPDSPYRDLRYAFLYGPSFSAELSVFDDLVSSGELSLLTDAELRRRLAVLNSKLGNARRVQEDLTMVQVFDVDRYMLDNVDMEQFYGEVLKLDVSDEARPADLAFVSSRTFRNVMLLKLDLVLVLIGEFESVVDALNDVRDSVAQELASG